MPDQETEMLVSSLPVAEAFDGISERFDHDLENDITRRIREQIYEAIETLVEPGSSLLDINCGTGIDAINLDRRGFRVTGIDLSPRMLEQAQRKVVRDERLDVRFLTGSFDRVSEIVEGPFDLVLSNFGGLNCTDQLSTVAKELSRVILPSGFFVAVVMPRFSLWESLSYAARGEWKESLRRSRQQTYATGFRGKTFIVHYHSPSSFMKAFEPWFAMRRLVGVSVFAPTPQSTTFVRTHPHLANQLEKLDTLLGGLPLIRSIGDHYMVVLQRKPR
jgi:ubiquinone/menaquinone biosynthesis C-methylase UbiE